MMSERERADAEAAATRAASSEDGRVNAAPLKKPRHFFQIHLSTAVVTMFVAAGLMWLNLVPQRLYDQPNSRYIMEIRGWPNEFHEGWISKGQAVPPGKLKVRELVVDVVFSLSILALIAFVTELFIRRRERGRS
jgi:hypothetical protein